MTWETRYTGPGTDLQRSLDRSDGPNMVIAHGQQFCEAGQHYVPRVPYVTHKGWMCDACKEKDDGQ
jgi:hypothetical protein